MANNINGAKYRDAPPSVIRRVIARREITAEGCWLWPGDTSHDGYGETKYRRDGKRPHVYVHRLAYICLVGDLSDDAELDHLCHVPGRCTSGNDCPHRRCFNPAHLEPVTAHVNLMRSGSVSAVKARRDRCDSGHLFDKANTYYPPSGGRVCLKCNNAWRRKRWAASRDEVNAERRSRHRAEREEWRNSRHCQRCESSIAHRVSRAIYCEECAVIVQREGRKSRRKNANMLTTSERRDKAA